MGFNPFHIDLPVRDIINDTRAFLQDQNTLVVSAPPGAGKSTLLPLALLNSDWLKRKKIIMLEPRRLATKSIAQRMASLLGEAVGETIGYRIRFETNTSDQTKLEVVTEGILTRMLHSDNALEDIGLIIFDEFHERSIHADVALALSRESQQILRPDLRIMVMSATLDLESLPLLLRCPVVQSEGKQYPVDLHYVGENDQQMLPEMAAKTIIDVSKSSEGDILAFFPGQGEIKKCEEILQRQLKEFLIHPLYGQLPYNKQQAAITPDKTGTRKIVLATSIAETSLTIEGIKIVVDTGFGRKQKFNPNTGLSRLETIKIAKDAADQRAGRAGRLSSGSCYRMWSKATQLNLPPHSTPEIMEADLCPLMLDLAQWGITDINQLTWLSIPPKGAVSQAKTLLEELGALERGLITDHGKAIHKLPCHPRIAHMLIGAEHNQELLALATDIAAVLEERDPLPQEAGIDINLRIEALRRYRNDKSGNNRLARIEKVASSYRHLFGLKPNNKIIDDYETGLLLAQAYPERIACARPGNNAQFQLANGQLASISHHDDLANESWLAIAHLNARKGMGKIFIASPLNPKDLAPLIKEKEVINWDTKHGGLIASKDMRIGSIILKSTPIQVLEETRLAEAICNAIKKEGAHLLNFDHEVTQWQYRILSLKKWNHSQNWPDISTENLLATCEEWLSPYLNNVKKPEHLKKINLKQVLQYSLSQEQQAKLEQLAPSTIKVPSGSNIKLIYSPNASPPILAVRLQELFGLTTTPAVNEGKNNALLHLLSPGFKPVQVTSDLISFWNNTYFEVKKELKRRYPKHSWPENPYEEPAVKGVKKKKP